MKIFKTSNFVGVLAVVLFAVPNFMQVQAVASGLSLSKTALDFSETIYSANSGNINTGRSVVGGNTTHIEDSISVINQTTANLTFTLNKNFNVLPAGWTIVSSHSVGSLLSGGWKDATPISPISSQAILDPSPYGASNFGIRLVHDYTVPYVAGVYDLGNYTITGSFAGSPITVPIKLTVFPDPNPFVSISSPTTGSTYNVGSTMNIVWKIDGIKTIDTLTDSSIDIINNDPYSSFWTGPGPKCQINIAKNVPISGSFSWLVGTVSSSPTNCVSSIAPGSKYILQIKINGMNSNGQVVSYGSVKELTIGPGTISSTTPPPINSPSGIGLYSTEPSPGRFIPGQTIKVYALGLRPSAMNPLYIDGKGFNNIQSWNPTGTNSGVPNSYETLVALPLDLSAGAHTLQMETSDVVENFGKVLSNSLPLNIFRTRAEAENPEDPTVTYVSPASAKPGDTVTVYGTNFNSDSYVMLDPYLDTYTRAQMGTKATTVTQTPTSISFIVPTQIKTGSMFPLIYNLHKVTVFPSKNKQATTVAYNGSLLNRFKIPLNGGEYSNAYFNIVSAVTPSTPQAPTITSISASSIPQGGTGLQDNDPISGTGSPVTITGSGFSSATSIIIDDGSNQYVPNGASGVIYTGFPVISWTATTISFRMASNIATGQHSIQVGSCGNHGSPCGAFLSNPIWVTVTPRGTAMGSTPGYATSDFTSTPPPANGDNATGNSATLQQQLVQLITTLLQLVQQAATRGLLTSSQVLSILSAVQATH